MQRVHCPISRGRRLPLVHSISDPCARSRPARALPARRRLCCAWLARNRIGLSRADPTRAIPFRSARRSKFQFRSARLAPWSARSRPARSWSALLTLGSVAVGRLSLIPRARSATSRSACSSTARAPGSLAHGWLALAPRLACYILMLCSKDFSSKNDMSAPFPLLFCKAECSPLDN